MTQPIVALYGGSAPRPGSPAYEEAYTVGKLLAEAGFTVMTGGYAGTMEAASKGAKDAGGHTVGVTVARFERAGQRVNPYVDEVVPFERLPDRLLYLVTHCDAAVALRGGIGTLSEVALTWSLLQVGEIGPKPFVLLGEQWRDLLLTYYGDGTFVRERDMHLFQLARTPEQVLILLRNWE